jgi:hypothetical protein
VRTPAEMVAEMVALLNGATGLMGRVAVRASLPRAPSWCCPVGEPIAWAVSLANFSSKSGAQPSSPAASSNPARCGYLRIEHGTPSKSHPLPQLRVMATIVADIVDVASTSWILTVEAEARWLQRQPKRRSRPRSSSVRARRSAPRRSSLVVRTATRRLRMRYRVVCNRPTRIGRE